MYVLFEPTRAGADSATLTLRGDGAPLQVALRATAFALPAVTRLTRDRVEPLLRAGDAQPGADHYRPARDGPMAAGG